MERRLKKLLKSRLRMMMASTSMGKSSRPVDVDVDDEEELDDEDDEVEPRFSTGLSPTLVDEELALSDCAGGSGGGSVSDDSRDSPISCIRAAIAFKLNASRSVVVASSRLPVIETASSSE